jgi:hypothetical protein
METTEVRIAQRGDKGRIVALPPLPPLFLTFPFESRQPPADSAQLGGEGEMEYCLQGAGVGGWPGCLSCSDRDLELKQACGCCAAAIFCRFSGRFSISDVEAISQPGHGSSKPALCEVMRSPQKAGGPWLRLIVGRGFDVYARVCSCR